MRAYDKRKGYADYNLKKEPITQFVNAYYLSEKINPFKVHHR